MVVHTVASEASAQAAPRANPTEYDWAQLIAERGWLPNIGQISDTAQRGLEKLVKRGELAKYRGHWDSGRAVFGMGPLKTIYALPEVAAYVAETDAQIKARFA